MAPRAGLDVLEKRFCHHRDLNPDRPARSIVAIPTELQHFPVARKRILSLRVSRVRNSRVTPRITIHHSGPSLDRRIKIVVQLEQFWEPYRTVFK